MKFYLLLFLLLCSGGSLLAQASILDTMAIREPGKGTVVVRQPYAIRSLVGSHSVSEKIEIEGDKRYLLMQGYRIQVFTDNNQRTAKNDAEALQQQIVSLFSVPTYVRYNAPFWRLYVGDYLSYEEAFSMSYKIAEAFPTLKKEIQIKEEEISMPIDLVTD